jgi:hypothetical protein
MTGLQELTKRTTITFPGSIDARAVLELFKHISKELGNNARLYGNFSGFFNFSCGSSDERYVSEMSGNIVQRGITAVNFSLLRDENNILGGFSDLRFNTPPGYDLEEVNPRELELYDEVRYYLDNFFHSDI